MKFTLSWLKEHLETTATVEQLSAALTSLGLEVESITDHSTALASFTVAEILEATPHPDADRLRVCRVMTRAGERQIVCGAPNARAGIKVALADIGAVIPNGGFTIKQSKIRGVESCGMLCSASELGLGKDGDGIMELPANAAIGTSIVEVLGLNDPLIEIAITPDRGDCLGVYGIARDLAAAGVGTLKPLSSLPHEGKAPASRSIRLETSACQHFVGCTIRGVTNGESPDWLKCKLESIGLRPISRLVDITNYFTMTYDRPLHVYDDDTLGGDIVVRDSNEGEHFKALNDKEYTTPAGLCTISDASGTFHGLGGVVGGEHSGCTLETRNVFLESAWFDPVAIATTGRTLQVESDARYRFERTVDPMFTQTGAEMAARMIVELCGGESSALTIAGAPVNLTRTIAFDPAAVQTLGGVDVSAEECLEILERLGFNYTGSKKGGQQASGGEQTIIVSSPSWRPDMEHPADLVEEILRIKGYACIPPTPLPPSATLVDTTPRPEVSTRRLLKERGMQECYHFAFISRKQAEPFATTTPLIMVANPISADLDTMRPSLLPALLAALGRNLARDSKSLSLFEVGAVFYGTTPELQPLQAAGIRSGALPLHWESKPRSFDIFDAKGDLITCLEALGINVEALTIGRETPAWYHPGKSGRLSLGPKNTLGYFGELHPAILRHFDIEQPVVACELLLANLPQKKKSVAYAPFRASDYQATRRDFAFVVGNDVAAGDLLRDFRGTDKQLVRDVTLFDVYAGKGVAEGHTSLAFSVTLQADDRTLTEEEITRVSSAIIAAAQKHGAELR